jgi:phage replication initiation protein
LVIRDTPPFYWSAVEADGDTIRLRLQAHRIFSKSSVSIDWWRASFFRRNLPPPSIDALFPRPSSFAGLTEDAIALAIEEGRFPIKDFNDIDVFEATQQAYHLAKQVAAILGKQFSVSSHPLKGMDFYKYRFSILLNDTECGWVGYLAASNSPHQLAQNNTIHVNLYGMACTFADFGWNLVLADFVDKHAAKQTRCDFALDRFDGVQGGIERINQQYKDGLCNVGGRKLKCNLVGDWNNGHDRSLYIGSRVSGKITNVYEKGDQLYGEKFGSDWLRIELRYGNQVRVLPTDMLRRPADFFAGASDWHAQILLEADLSDALVVAAPVPRLPRLEIETVKAECARSISWLNQTAGPSLALAIQYLDESELRRLCMNRKLPGRLSKFSRSDIQKQMSSACHLSFSVGSRPAAVQTI